MRRPERSRVGRSKRRKIRRRKRPQTRRNPKLSRTAAAVFRATKFDCLYHPANVRCLTKSPVKIVFLFLLGSTNCAWPERPFPNAAAEAMRIPASRIHSREVPSQIVDLRRGIGPDEAATIALYSNPALRAIRDRRSLAIAQVVQAGILPNVSLSYERDYVTGGNTVGTQPAYALNAGWEFTALIPYLPKQTAARKNLGSVDLGVAWQ